MAEDYTSQFSGPEIDARLAKVPTLESEVSGKQDALQSGVNIKTINGQSIVGSGNIDTSNQVTVDSELSESSTNPVQNKAVTAALKQKQGTIPDLDTIRTGAIKGSSAYQKPANGIPASDLESGVVPDVSGFVTKSVNDLLNYYLKSETYTKAEVQSLIGSIQQFHYEIAESTSSVSSPSSNVLYLIGPSGSGSDVYEQYVYDSTKTDPWIKIGDTSIDLSGYVTITALNSALASYVTSSALESALANYATKSEVSQLQQEVDEIFPTTFYISGAGNTYISKRINTLIPGHTYRFQVKSWDQTGVTSASSYDGFVISSYDANNTRTYLVHLYCGTPPMSSYELAIPLDSAYISIAGRVTSGYNGNIFIEDITANIKEENDTVGSEYNYVSGFYLNSEGKKYPAADSVFCEEYIPVSLGQIITWHHGYNPAKGVATLVVYNSAKEKAAYYTCNADNERVITIGSASYAYIRATFSASASNAYIKINDKVVWEKKDGKGLSGKIDNLRVIKYNVATIETRGGKLDDNGVWLNTAKWLHILLPCKKGDIFKVIGGYESKYALIRWNMSPYTGDKAILSPETSPTPLPVGVTTTITIPDDCIYIYFESGDSSDNRTVRVNLPDSIVKETALLDNVENLRSDAVTPKISTTVSFVGGGDTYNTSYAKVIRDIVPGGAYRIHFVKKPTAHSGTRNYPRTRVWSINANNQSTQLVVITQSESLPDYVDVTLLNDAVAMQVGGRCAYGEVQEMLVERLSAGSGGSGILDLNPDSEFIPKMQSVYKRYYTGSATNYAPPLVIAHLSDIHANWVNVERFIEFTNHHAGKIDLKINTGDTVFHQYSQGIDGYSAIDGADEILNVIGNHDTLTDTEQEVSWIAHVGVDAYNLLIKPFVSNWGVTQPENAESLGKCYYYKDYSAKNIRLIFLDVMGYDDTQNDWLISVLEGARVSGYHVAIVAHFCPARTYADRESGIFDVIPCNFSTLYESGTGSTQQTGYNANTYKIGDAVNEFMINGGHFVGYIMGHYHKGFIAKHVVYPNQLIYAVGSSKSGEVSDYLHTVGTRSQDEFEIIGIDTKNTIVKIFTVGADYDRYGRKKGSVCVDYTTGHVLGEGW